MSIDLNDGPDDVSAIMQGTGFNLRPWHLIGFSICETR